MFPGDILLNVVGSVQAVEILIDYDQRRRLHDRKLFAELRLFLSIDQFVGNPCFFQHPSCHLAVRAGLGRKQQYPAFRRF